MDKRIAKQWVARLRSGAIPQTRKHLAREDGSRCCLGVLCDMAVEEGIIPPPAIATTPGRVPSNRILAFDNARHNLPSTVREWAQIITACANHPGKRFSGGAQVYQEQASLALDNDHGATFAQLADTIETHADAL